MTAGSPRPSRWWLAGVPLAIATMLAANAYRVPTFWYQSGQHHEIATGPVGEWLPVAEQTSDAHGNFVRKYDVRFAGLGSEQTAYEDRFGSDFTLPDGMVARTVDLDFRADPAVPLKNCAVSLIDDDGREFRVGHVFDGLGATVTVCVPEKAPGPSVPVFRTQPRGALGAEELPRPTQWSTSPAIAVPRDAKLVELRISFENPDYVTLRLR